MPQRRRDDALAEPRDRGERPIDRGAQALLVGRVIEDREVAEVGAERGILLDRPHDRFGVRHPHARTYLSPGLPGDARVLELVEAFNSSRSSTRSMSSGRVALHQAHERGAFADDERRYAEHRVLLHRFGVLGGERLERPARLATSAATASASSSTDVRSRRGARPPRRASRRGRGGRRTARCAQSRKWSGNASRTAMPHRARARRCPVRRAALPDRRLALLDVHLVERERRGSARPSRVPARSPGHDGLVGVAGEGAAVVEAHGEAVGRHRCGPPWSLAIMACARDHGAEARRRARGRTRRRRRTSEAWCRRT